MSRNVEELVDKVTQPEGLQTGPTEREKLEKESSVLEEDVNKFNAMIAGFDERIRKMEELVEEKDKEMKEKLGEHKRICHENEELKKKVELQTFNAHNAERMKKELQAVERDIEDVETARSAWEDKCWDLDVHSLVNLRSSRHFPSNAIKPLGGSIFSVYICNFNSLYQKSEYLVS